MDPRSRSLMFLEKLSRQYYTEKARLHLPRDIGYREFAIQPWRSNSYVRHLAFSSEDAVKRYASEKGPRHFYYSSARYDQPGARDMDAKGWMGADIVIDIDADHLPQCSDQVVEVEDKTIGVKASFAPPECLREAALQAYLVFDVLINEIGFEKQRISVEFSGHRGFHIVVSTQGTEWDRAGPDARRELVNYLKAVDLSEEVLWPKPPAKRKRFVLLDPSPTDPGLRGRFARFREILGKAGKGSERETVIEYLSLEVDEQVTVDVKRLIRIPGSLNGKTMLPVLKLNPEDVLSFEASTELSPFKDLGTIKIKPLVDTPVIDVLGHRIKLRKGVVMKLDAPIALYLLAKEVAVLG